MPASSHDLSHVFKAYDIRGLAPQEIDAPFAERLGYAISAQFTPKRVMVGRDMRITSPELEASLIKGLTESGVHVVRIGLCSTPMFNILLGLADGTFDLGVMVTASHNPGKYNGFKITRGDCQPVGQGTGMEALRDVFLKNEPLPSGASLGTVEEDPTALNRYLDYIISLAHIPEEMPRMRIAIDAGNGMGGFVLPHLLSKLPWIDAVPLFFEPDGSFPNHEANPLKHETLSTLIKTVSDEQRLLGVAFDGDADRVGFVDETGEQIPGDLLTAFLAEEILHVKPDGLVLYDVRSSWSVPEAVGEAGGHAEMCQVGHANIKRLMRERVASFAGELSMHFYFSELWNCESGDYAMLLLLKKLARENKPLSDLWRPLKRYAKSEELNFPVRDAHMVIARLEQRYSSEAKSISKIDGIRMEFRDEEDESRDWWFNVRASNTEPLLRLNVEARTALVLAERIQMLEQEIREADVADTV